MGTCAIKYGANAREHGSSPGGYQVATEPEETNKKNTQNGVWQSISLRESSCHLFLEDRSFGSVLLRRQPHQTRLSPFVGVRICGVPASTVPKSQPYLALGDSGSLSGRLPRPKKLTCKLKVTEGILSSSRDLECSSRPCVCGTKQPIPASSFTRPNQPDKGPDVDFAVATKVTTTYNDAYIGGDTDLYTGEGVNVATTHSWKLSSVNCRTQQLSPLHSPARPVLLSSLSSFGCTGNGRTWRLCVSSVSTDLPQANFEEKAVQVLGANPAIGLADIGVSVVCKKGYKPNCPNNDGFFVSHLVGCTVCCVLDGHGPCGYEICNIVQKQLIRLTASNPALASQPRRILQEAILTTHKELTTTYSTMSLDSKLSGATATIVVYLRKQNKLVVAHVGNSRAVLCRLGKRGCGISAVDLTVDHTPSSSTELRRISKYGGQVRVPAGDGFHRVFLKNDSLPGLAVARSIGDTLAGRAGVTAEPDITEYKLDVKRDAFLLLCTDGVWNIMSSQEAVELAYSARRKGWQTAPEVLARESWRRWINQEHIFADDITALLMELS